MYIIKTELKQINSDLWMNKCEWRAITNPSKNISLAYLQAFLKQNIKFQNIFAKCSKYPNYQEFIPYLSVSADPQIELDILCGFFENIMVFSKDNKIYRYGVYHPRKECISLWNNMIKNNQINALLQHFTYPLFHNEPVYDEGFICYEILDDETFIADEEYKNFCNDRFIQETVLHYDTLTNLVAICIPDWTIEQILKDKMVRYLVHCVDHLYIFILEMGEKFTTQLRWYNEDK